MTVIETETETARPGEYLQIIALATCKPYRTIARRPAHELRTTRDVQIETVTP